MTVAPDGGYLTADGQPVTTEVLLIGRYHCAACQTTTLAATRSQLQPGDYDPGAVRAVTNWTALDHAKTCTARSTMSAARASITRAEIDAYQARVLAVINEIHDMSKGWSVSPVGSALDVARNAMNSVGQALHNLSNGNDRAITVEP